MSVLSKLMLLLKRAQSVASTVKELNLTKYLPWLNRFGIIRLVAGKHASLAMYVMSLIVEAYEKRTTSRITKAVYENLPVAWKAPQGPATEKELNEAIKQGILFARCLNDLDQKA